MKLLRVNDFFGVRLRWQRFDTPVVFNTGISSKAVGKIAVCQLIGWVHRRSPSPFSLLCPWLPTASVTIASCCTDYCFLLY